jgi:hypothetical protein
VSIKLELSGVIFPPRGHYTSYAAVHYKIRGFILQGMQLYITRYAAVHYKIRGCVLQGMLLYITRYAALYYKVRGFVLQGMRLYSTRYADLHYKVCGCILQGMRLYIKQIFKFYLLYFNALSLRQPPSNCVIISEYCVGKDMEGNVRRIITGTTREFHPDVSKWAMRLFSGIIATGLWR